MSSFFTLPASQKKRKREDAGATAGAARASAKRRGAASRPTGADGSAPRAGRSGKGRPRRAAQSDSGLDDDDDDDDDDDEALSDDAGSIAGSEVGDDDEDAESEGGDADADADADAEETAADRRLRLAERYLDNVKAQVGGEETVGFDAAEIDRDLIAERLREDVDEFKGRVFRQIADKLAFAAPTTHSFFRADTQATTSVAIHPPYVYTVSKDKTLIKWELAAPAATTATSEKRRPPRRKPRKLAYVRGLQRTDADDGAQHGHTGAILTVAASPSGAFVATGGADRRIIVWDAATLAPLRTFSQHRDAISGLSFSRAGPDYALGSNNISSGEQLFSASFDRTIKTWSLAPGAHAYVETLFGHQDHVLDVAAMAADQCVSVGARDRTARLWKVVDETQLIFRGGSSTNKRGRTGAAANESDTPAEAEGSIERIAALPPAHFVTGSDNGALALWSIHKKKPLCTVPLAHGRDPLPPAGDLSAERDPAVAQRVTARLRPSPRWITALAALPGTDVVLSGSWDGWVRAWRVSEDKRRLVPLGVVGGDEATGEGRIRGVVNDIAVFERRDRSAAAAAFANAGPAGDEGEEQARQPAGLCVVAAVGKECRLGRWKTLGSKRVEGEPAGRNGAVVIEVPFKDGVDVEKEGEADTAES